MELSLVILTENYCSRTIRGTASKTEISFIGNKKYEKMVNQRLVLL
jgi:hypothetical protein